MSVWHVFWQILQISSLLVLGWEVGAIFFWQSRQMQLLADRHVNLELADTIQLAPEISQNDYWAREFSSKLVDKHINGYIIAYMDLCKH